MMIECSETKRIAIPRSRMMEALSGPKRQEALGYPGAKHEAKDTAGYPKLRKY
jgi:hypothetical protein